MATSDTLFAGSIPDLYDRLLVPLIFEPYARDLAERVSRAKPQLVLETAAGTGAVTRELASSLADARIIVTDLNRPMRWRYRSKTARSTLSPVSSARCFFPTKFGVIAKHCAS